MALNQTDSTNGDGVEIPRGRSSIPKVLSHHEANTTTSSTSLPPSHYNNAPLLSEAHDNQATMSNPDPENSEKRESEKSPPPPSQDDENEVVFVPRGKRDSSLGSDRTGSEASTTILLDENLPQTETAAAAISDIKTLLDTGAQVTVASDTSGEQHGQETSEEVWKEDKEGPIKLKKKVRKEREAEEKARKEMLEDWGLKK